MSKYTDFTHETCLFTKQKRLSKWSVCRFIMLHRNQCLHRIKIKKVQKRERRNASKPWQLFKCTVILKLNLLFQLPEITDTCSKFMATLLDLSNFSRFLAMANELDLLWLSDRIYLFLEWNFYDLIPMPCFLKMKSSQLHRVTCGRGLRLEREETLYNAVMRWYDFKPASRSVDDHRVYCRYFYQYY